MILEKTYFRNFAIKNRWIIIASVFFIAWKFFLINVLWQDRLSPPEPDDSYIYIGYINSIKECPRILCDYPSISFASYTGFAYLPYRLFFGIISKILNINPETIFHFSFYFGTLFILPVLLFFLRALTENKKLISFSLFFLALYNGNGSFHGFFWVVPSFFALALFFLIFSTIQKNVKPWIIALTFLVPIFIYMHPISIYSVFIFPIYFFINFIFEKKIDREIIKKIIFTIILATASYLPMYLHFKNTGVKNSLGIEASAKKIKENVLQIRTTDNPATPAKATLPGFKEIKNGYILWIFPNWIGILIFSFFFSVVLYYKQYRLLSLYLSLALFTAISSLNEFGFRSLILIWPITFVLYAFGFWYSYVLLTEKIKDGKIKKFLRFMLFFSVSLFAMLNLIFSFFWNQNTNYSQNIKVSNDFTDYLYKNTSKKDAVLFSSKLPHSFSLTTNLIERNIGVRNIPLEEKYYIVMERKDCQTKRTSLDKFYDMLSKWLKISRSKQLPEKQTPIEYPDFVLDKKFDSILIYKNTKY
jgi:hypothetical protein